MIEKDSEREASKIRPLRAMATILEEGRPIESNGEVSYQASFGQLTVITLFQSDVRVVK